MPRPPFQIRDFIGQRRALAPVLREQDGAKARGEPMPPILFTGQSGLGKSLAARTLAARAGTSMVTLVSSESPEHLATRLAKMKMGDIAFLDECHRLQGESQELLFEVIDSGTVSSKFVPDTAGEESFKIAPITLILATDRPGRLLNALLKRIQILVQFAPYTERELKEIVARVATRSKILLSPQAAKALARVCAGIPRRAEHHVRTLRLYFADSERRQLGLSDVVDYLHAHGIDRSGIGRHERRYLDFLACNRSASLDALAAHLGTDPEFVRQQVEQPLRHRRLILVRSSGRTLTRRGQSLVEHRRQARKAAKDKKNKSKTTKGE
jgi:Holliday junction DNA helicase RuvB